MRLPVIIISFFIPALTFAGLKQADYCAIQKSFLFEKENVFIDTVQNVIDTSHEKATIDNLKIGSRYLINVESNGCFHHSLLLLTITRNDNGYFATFKMTGNIEGRKVKQHFKKTKLNEPQLDSLRMFENKLIAISKNNDSCTTTDVYNLNDGIYNKLYTDNICSWQGIGKLVAVFFKASIK